MNITFDTKVIADFSLVTITGSQETCFYRLKFNFRVDVPDHGDRIYFLSNLKAEISLKGESLLGTAFPENPISIKTGKYQTKLSKIFLLDLRADQINAIEEIRKGGDIILHIEMRGEASDGKQLAWYPAEQDFPVNQKTWIVLLRQINYSDFLLFEIPIPFESPDSIKSSIEMLKEAQEHFFYGKYRNVVGSCRDAIESLEKALDDKNECDKAIERYNTKKRDMSKDERFLFLRGIIRHYTHLGAHPTENYFCRADANMVLGMTAAVITNSLMTFKN